MSCTKLSQHEPQKLKGQLAMEDAEKMDATLLLFAREREEDERNKPTPLIEVETTLGNSC